MASRKARNAEKHRTKRPSSNDKGVDQIAVSFATVDKMGQIGDKGRVAHGVNRMTIPAVSSPSQLLRVISLDIDDELRRKMASIIVDAYYDAELRCEVLRPMTRRDTVAHMRRGLMETKLAEAMAAAGATVIDKPNDGRTSYHVQVTIGRCILTVHAVNNAGELPRDADFRFTAAQSAQTEMYEQQEPPPPDAKIYLQVIYGPRCGSLPTFASIVVPNSDCSEIVAVIPMYEELCAARADRSGRESQAAFEAVPDEVSVTIKPGSPPVYETDFDKETPATTEGVKQFQLSLLSDLTVQKPAKEEGSE